MMMDPSSSSPSKYPRQRNPHPHHYHHHHVVVMSTGRIVFMLSILLLSIISSSFIIINEYALISSSSSSVASSSIFGERSSKRNERNNEIIVDDDVLPTTTASSQSNRRHNYSSSSSKETPISRTKEITTPTKNHTHNPINSIRSSNKSDKSNVMMTTTTTTETTNNHHNNSNNNNRNRTLVILIGNLRCGEKAWQSLYTNVLDNNSADLGLIGVNDVNGRYTNSSLFSRAKYIWTTPEYEDWADALDLIGNNNNNNGTSSSSSSWRQTVLPQISQKALDGGLLGGIFNTPSSGAIQGMMKYWLSQYIKDDKSIDDYDTFIVTRTDQFYTSPLEIQLQLIQQKPSCFADVYVPIGEDYKGICDRFMIICGGKDILLKALDILPPFLNDYDPNIYGDLSNPEGLLYASLQRKQLRIHRIGRVMFTCAAIHGGQDHTRWRKVSSSSKTILSSPINVLARSKYGVDFKYKTEFVLVQSLS